MSKKVLVTDYVWPSVEPERAVLAEIGADLVVAPDGSEETLISLAKDVDGILTCFAKVTDKVVRAAKRCLAIGRYGVGVDNIAVETASSLGIVVTYVPDYCIDEVSDHVMGLLLGWNRRIVLFDRATKTLGWGSEGLGMRIMRLRGKSLGIVGFGRIGRAVAEKAKVFGMDILAYDPFLTPEGAARSGGRQVDLDTLLKESDFVTLHTPLIPETHNLIGEEQLALMKQDAFLINAARGGLIDENALYNALTTNQIAGVGVDVLEDLNPPMDHRLIQLGNVIVTPHTAFFSQEAVLELEERAASEVASVLENRVPDNIVNPEVLSQSNLRANGLFQ
ncbi:C-terminal binding protein [Dehalococcoidia bacterium]|nr:C-terminal binding protein [Dehalococcoidia bacterium]